MSDASLFTDDPAPESLFTDTPAPKSTGEKILDTAKTVGGGVLDTLSAPFQLAGEAVRGAGEGEPLKFATKEDPSGFRAPSIVQRMAPSLRTDKAPADVFQKSYQGLEGLANLPGGLAQASDVVKSEPDLAAQIGGGALALGALPMGAAKSKVPLSDAAFSEEAAEVPHPAPGPKELPVVEPGSKTGDPHALFAYNDEFGENGPRSIYNVFGDPAHPALKDIGHGSSVPEDVLAKAGIPVTGREPRSVGKWEPIDSKAPDVVPMGGAESKGVPPSRMPPDPNAPPLPTGKPDPFKDVRDWIASKGSKVEAQPGWVEKVAKYLKNEAGDLGAKDLGLQSRQIAGMGYGFKGNEKAEALIDYARQKGYLDPALSDVARKEKVIVNTKQAGERIGALRDIASQRAAPPIDLMRTQLKEKLTNEFGIDAPGEIDKVMAKFEKKAKEDPTFSGMADLATDLNKAKTPARSMGQHPGPTTEGANLIGKLNNEAARKTFNPEEAALYTNSLRDFGAHKQLEQIVAGAGRRKMAARSNQRGPLDRAWQEALDRGGYRIAGNVANKVSGTILKNPGKIKTLSELFEEMAHETNDTFDDAIAGQPGMFKGGRVPGDVKSWVSSRGC